MCLKTAPLTKPSASELPFPSVAPTLCQDAGRSYSLSAYPGQCRCEQCLQQKGKKRGRWPNLSFHFRQMLGSAPAHMTVTQSSLGKRNPTKGSKPPGSTYQMTLPSPSLLFSHTKLKLYAHRTYRPFHPSPALLLVSYNADPSLVGECKSLPTFILQPCYMCI